MSDMTLNDDGHDGNKGLEELTIAQLRQYAKLYRITLEKDATKPEIVEAIKLRLKNKQILKVVDESKAPAPGRWRIVVQKDSSIGIKAGSRPVPVFVNGYRCDIPRGVPVDVPEKVVRLLETCRHPQVIEDPDRSGYSKIELLPSYPFQVLAFTPGPDPQPGFEKVKEAGYRPRARFYQMFDYWPSKSALREAIKSGLIKLKDDEFVEGDRSLPTLGD